MSLRRRAAVVALAGGLAAAAVGSAVPAASGLDDAPPSAGCAGVSFTDSTGDALNDPVGLGLGLPGAGNEDVTEGFFRTDGGVTTANLRILDLSKKVPQGAQKLIWYVFYTTAAGPRYVSATTDGTSVVFATGEVRNEGGGLVSYVDTGTVAGRLFEGQSGLVQMEIPAADAAAGAVLRDPSGAVLQFVDLLGQGFVSPADTAPDTGAGTPYTVGACATAASGQAPRTRPVLGLHAPHVIGSARAANRTRRLSFRVNATDSMSDLRLSLRAGAGRRGRTVASGRRAAAKGVVRVSLAVRRRVRPGVYVLRASGLVDGSRRTVSLRVGLRR